MDCNARVVVRRRDRNPMFNELVVDMRALRRFGLDQRNQKNGSEITCAVV